MSPAIALLLAAGQAGQAPLAGSADGQFRSAAEASLDVYGEYALANPLFLVLVPVVIAALAWGRSRRGRSAARVSVLPGVPLPRSLRQRTTWTAPLLQGLALVCCVVALARPLRGNVLDTTVSEGVDIALVFDRSSSMAFQDLDPDGEKSRFDVVKEVVEDFAIRRMTDREGNADNVALIAFAYYPEILCPFTLDVNALTNFLRPSEIVEAGGQEDGTAIGTALAKAVSMLRDSEAKSKVVVLLTDGVNNIDDITPKEAAELAAAEDVRVYTIHAARYVYKYDRFNARTVPTNDPPDTRELEAIAETTGGRFYRARDRDALEAVYDEIEELERTPREEKRYTETFDLYPYFLQAALALYLGAWLLGATWARRLP